MTKLERLGSDSGALFFAQEGGQCYQMNRRIFIAAIVIVPLLVCSILPDLIFSELYGQWGTNLIWGLVFGFGWWVAQSLGGPEHWRAAAEIGVFLWPPLVLAGLFLLGRTVWQSRQAWVRKTLLGLLAISCLPIMPAKTTMSLYANARVPPDFNLLIVSW
jgi:hypothetical protein